MCVAVTGGTGSLGQRLVRRILGGDLGKPRKVVVFSRDEAKQHYMRLEYKHRPAATDEVIYHVAEEVLDFRIGDVRDFASVCSCLADADVVFNAAALKQVPSCEYFPYEAVLTNVAGPQNIVRAVREGRVPACLVVGISTDKACKPVNVMGMTKALQERVLLAGNLNQTRCDFLCVRYGNVLASRGSVIPLFIDQIRTGGPVTITLPEMTRFLLSLDDAVDTIFAAVGRGVRGETYVPRVPSARVLDIAEALINGRPIDIRFAGIRPGEKIHEILVSEEEAGRTLERDGYYVIESILPELRAPLERVAVLAREYSSGHEPMGKAELKRLLDGAGFIAAVSVAERQVAP
jgi:UDP-glucose 4-epimerase